MQNFHDTFDICERSFISGFSVCMTVPLSTNLTKINKNIKPTNIYFKFLKKSI